MSEFYDDIYEDVDDLLEDYGRPVTINGTPIEKALKNDEGQGWDETRDVTIHVKSYIFKQGLIRRPKCNEALDIEDEEWIVTKSDNKHGFVILQVFKEVS